MNLLARITLVSLTLALAPACTKAAATVETTGTVEAEMSAAPELGDDALVEEHDGGTVAWRIDGDGQVKAAVTATSGARIKEDVAGTLVWQLPSGEAKTVPLALDARTGMLVAAGPRLEADLTQVDYTLTISGKPWSGVLHVPAGGTTALVASAKATAEVKLPDVTAGPHGGSIQLVGEDRVELVANETTGDVRVYILDADLRPVPIEGRTLKLGIVAARPELLVLAPATAGLYFVGRLAAAVNPFKITVALGFHGATHVALWGYRPGVRVIATAARAPRVNILVKSFVDGPDIDVRAGARADVDVHVHGGDKAKVIIHENDHGGDKAKVMIHENGHGGGDKVNLHVKTGGGDKVNVHVKSGGGDKAHAHGNGGASKGGGGKGKH